MNLEPSGFHQNMCAARAEAQRCLHRPGRMSRNDRRAHLQGFDAEVEEEGDGDQVVQRHAARVDQLVRLVQHQPQAHLRDVGAVACFFTCWCCSCYAL